MRHLAMRHLAVLACGLLAALLPAGASATDIVKAVPSGTTRQIDFFASIHPDCSPVGIPVVRLIDGPTKGLITTEPGRDFLPFARGNPRSRCNSRRLAGLKLLYRSADDFVGTDRVRLLILSGNGDSREAIYTIEVR